MMNKGCIQKERKKLNSVCLKRIKKLHMEIIELKGRIEACEAYLNNTCIIEKNVLKGILGLKIRKEEIKNEKS